MSIKVTIDPGHDEKSNVSPTVKSYIEGKQMFILAGYLAEALAEYGIETEITRKKVTDNPAITDRGKHADKNGSRLFISLHSNAPGPNKDGSYDTTITGTCVYYSLTDAKNKALAESLGKAIAQTMGHTFRGALTREYSAAHKDWDYYGVLRGAAQNGCKAAFLIEHGFHTCPKDAGFLLSSANLKKLAKAEAQVIADYLGENKQVYVAQVVKAFDSQSAAEAFRDKLIADGYDAIVVKA